MWENYSMLVGRLHTSFDVIRGVKYFIFPIGKGKTRYGSSTEACTAAGCHYHSKSKLVALSRELRMFSCALWGQGLGDGK